MSRPSPFAVLRLITNSYLVGACTGRVGRFFALEDAIDVLGRASELVNEIGPIGDQAAGGDEVALVVDRGQFMLSRERGDQVPIGI